MKWSTQNVLRRTEHRAFVLLLSGSLSAACSGAPDETNADGNQRGSVAQKAEVSQSTASTSPQPIVVQWAGREPASTDSALLASVHNTTTKTLLVDISINAIAPGGQRGANSLGTHTIPGNGHVDFTISLDELPVQTVGVPTSVTFVANYQISQPLPRPVPPGGDGSLQSLEVRQMALTASSSARFVTFNRGFASAVIRAAGAQFGENTRVMRTTQAIPAPLELRGYDSRLGALTPLSMAPVAFGNSAPSTTTFYETPLSELPIPQKTTGGTP